MEDEAVTSTGASTKARREPRARVPIGGTGLVYSGVTGKPAIGQSVRWRLLFSGIWLLYLIQPISKMFSDHRGAWWIAGAFILVAVFSALYIVLICSWASRPGFSRRVLAALYAIAVLACLALGGQGWNALWIYVSAATGLVMPDRRTAIRGVLAVSASFALFSWLGHDNTGDFVITLLPVLVVGLATSGMRVLSMVMHELSQAREEVARLAVSEERLRLARDMHDLTGQSLSMITLKSELASRILSMLPDSMERDRAREQIDEVAAVSRQTLKDIREAVSGYRRPTIAVEAITARTALTAAGIETRDDPALQLLSGTFDADAEAALAWCLREATTNVIRHSGARHCEIGLATSGRELTLTVCDDGRGVRPSAVDSTGSGLRGMSERLTAVGGHLRMEPAPAGGFLLVATVPRK
jgi:two-component system sensor histidine kinase DesK